MRKFIFSTTSLLALITGSSFASDTPLIGIVNFADCITGSKYGRKEQENMENLRKQMASLIENTEKEFHEITAKLEDTEYLDSLSPTAEEELKGKQQALQEDLQRYQQQFYQVLNHANYQMGQKLSNNISQAAAVVAEKNDLDYVINGEACFYVRPKLNVTTLVISEMDNQYELSEKTKKLSDNSEDSLQIDETTLDRAG